MEPVQPSPGASRELPQRLTELFQRHYDTALGAKGRSGSQTGRTLSQTGRPLVLGAGHRGASREDLSACSAEGERRPGHVAAPEQVLGLVPQLPAVAAATAPNLMSPSTTTPWKDCSTVPSHGWVCPGQPMTAAAGHVGNLSASASGALTGTHVWAGYGSQLSGNPIPSPLNFPHFRLRNAVSTDSSGSGRDSAPAEAAAAARADQSVPAQNGKRPSAAPVPAPAAVQKPRKRGRPSKKDKAEAASAAAAASAGGGGSGSVGGAQGVGARDAGGRHLPNILPKGMVWNPLDCATESAAVMLRQHRAKQVFPSPTFGGPTQSQHNPGAPVSKSVVSDVYPSISGTKASFSGVEQSMVSVGNHIAFGHASELLSTPLTGTGCESPKPQANGGPATSLLSRFAGKQLDIAGGQPDPAPAVPSASTPADVGGLSLVVQGDAALGTPLREVEGAAREGVAEASAPAPHSTPALDWMLQRMRSQGKRLLKPTLVFGDNDEHGDESEPSPSASLILGAVTGGSTGGVVSRFGGGNISLLLPQQQQQQPQQPSPSSNSTRPSHPPAAVMVAASKLLARHCQGPVGSTAEEEAENNTSGKCAEGGGSAEQEILQLFGASEADHGREGKGASPGSVMDGGSLSLGMEVEACGGGFVDLELCL